MEFPIYKTGFIGCGNMASAILNGILRNGILRPSDVYVYDIDREKTNCFLEKGICICESIPALAEQSDVIFLCVKPNIIPDVLRTITQKNKSFVSIAAGVTVENISKLLDQNSHVMRIMPNTPLLAGRGVICIQEPNNFLEEERNFIHRIFAALGMIEEVRGIAMDAVTGVSGSGPAYVYFLIAALAKAGEANGLDDAAAFRLALQTFEGACAMLRRTEKPPEQLIKEVCSPGGTTIEAMKVFENKNICGIINEAVTACVRRSEELSK